MPKPTFLKLKPEKRAHFNTLALQAFALQNFGAVSITRLMQALALPKGSFYQYFEDKKDLYFYLFDHFQQKKAHALATQTTQNKPPASFFDLWANFLCEELAYYWQNTAEWSFWLNANNERNTPEIGDLQAIILNRTAQQMLGSLRQESRQGNIRQDINIELQAYFLAQTHQGIAQFLLHKYGLKLTEAIEQDVALPAFPAIEVRMVVRQWIDLLKSSITNNL